jgi:hypothetical protein
VLPPFLAVNCWIELLGERASGGTGCGRGIFIRWAERCGSWYC